MKKILLLFLLSTFIFGCATAHKISNVQIGMTKEEVMQTMGRPASTSATEGTEYLNYSLSETDDQAFYGITRPYYVRIINGKVDSYGRVGDFDSTQKPTVRIETEENITNKTTLKVDNKQNLYLELKKLKELKDENIISTEEFETKKKELLERL